MQVRDYCLSCFSAPELRERQRAFVYNIITLLLYYKTKRGRRLAPTRRRRGRWRVAAAVAVPGEPVRALRGRSHGRRLRRGGQGPCHTLW